MERKRPDAAKSKLRHSRNEKGHADNNSWTPEHHMRHARTGTSTRPASKKLLRRPKQQPRRRSWIAILELFGVVGILAGIGWFMLTSPHYNIRHIHIDGLQTINSRRVGAAAGIPASENIFRYFVKERKSLCYRVANCDPAIASVSAAIQLPDTVVLDIQERQPYTVLHLENGLSYVMDSQRIPFRGVAINQLDLPLVTIPTPGSSIVVGKALPPDVDSHVAAAYNLLDLLNDRQIGSLTDFRELTVDSDDNVDLRLDNGLIIKLGQSDGMGERLSDLETALTAKPSLISDAQYLDFTTSRYAIMNKTGPLSSVTGANRPNGPISPLSATIGQ